MEIHISNASDDPIYRQIADQVERMILAGKLSPGDALPSMRLLAKELRISVITTKHAYEALETAGFIENVQGKGCFVAAQSEAMLRETRLHMAQEHLRRAVDVAVTGGVTLPELHEMTTLLYEEATDDA